MTMQRVNQAPLGVDFDFPARRRTANLSRAAQVHAPLSGETEGGPGAGECGRMLANPEFSSIAWYYFCAYLAKERFVPLAPLCLCDPLPSALAVAQKRLLKHPAPHPPSPPAAPKAAQPYSEYQSAAPPPPTPPART